MVLVICTFCGLDFKSLGRHPWRCKAKLEERDSGTTANERSSGISDQGSLLDGASEEVKIRVINTSGVKCVCGKHCKGIRGLKLHQLTCRFITELSEEIDAMNDERYEVRKVYITEFIPNEDPQLKSRIKLPKSDSEWALSKYFSG